MVRWLLCLLILFAAYSAGALPPVDAVEKLRAMSATEAAKHLPVRFEGTVVYCDSSKQTVVVHDGVAGANVRIAPGCPDRARIQPGARVKVEGVSDTGLYFPRVLEAKVTFLGMGKVPEPRQVGGGELFDPELDAGWVEVPATVVGVEQGGKNFTLVMEIQGVIYKALLPYKDDSVFRAATLMQRHVRLRGVLRTISNAQRQMTGRCFLVPSFDQIVPVEKQAASSQAPLRQINELLRCNHDQNALVRVRGTVTQVCPTGMYLKDSTGSTKVSSAEPGLHPPGSTVEVEGYAAVAPYRPELRAVRVEKVGGGEFPGAVPFNPQEAKLAHFHDELVKVDCEFLAQREGRNELILQCRAGDYYFEALLPASRMPGLASGDRLRLVGICEITSSSPIQRGDLADGFRLLLPGPEAVTVLQPAPWWTLRRVLVVLGVVVVLLLGLVIWNALLRRRVAVQAGVISRQIEQGLVLDERQRIARELHDSVEQLLTGLAMQLDNVSGLMARGGEEALHSLALAQVMLRHCREETRASVDDLRNQTLLECGLAAILEERLAPEVAGRGVKLDLRVDGKPRRLSATVEHHLLRMAQQGVANAVSHASASEIRVSLTYGADRVALEVADDGCGFDPSAPLPPGHFGILGLRERARKMGAEFSLESSPGSGTVIYVSLKADSFPSPLEHEVQNSDIDRG